MRLTLALVAGLMVLSLTAQADILYNDLGSTTFTGDPVQSFGPSYNSFSTGASAFSLTDVMLRLDKTSDSSGSISVGLYADSGNNPGGALVSIGTLMDSSLTNSQANYDLTLTTPYTLAANTRYWIGLTGNNNGSSAEWDWTMDQSGTGVAGEFHSSKTLGTFANGWPYQMEVSGRASQLNPVPEPSSVILLITMLGSCTFLAGRRLTSKVSH